MSVAAVLPAPYQVCGTRSVRAHMLVSLRGAVGQWRRIMKAGPPEAPLPAAARTALAEAATALQPQLAGGELRGCLGGALLG